MKKLLVKYAAFNHWANKRFSDLLVNLTDEQLNKDITSSYRSIVKTMLHLWDVEAIWLLRIKQHPYLAAASKDFNGSIIELTTNLLEQSRLWKEWINIATEEVLERDLSYKNMAGEEFTQPLWEILVHLFDHQSYHRGQIVTMLRQVGVTSGIPGTGFVAFARGK